MMLERGRGFKGDWLYSVDECLESDSPAVDCDVAGHNDLPRRSFEEAVPYKSWQPADLPDIFKQRCETGVQTEVTESSTLLLENYYIYTVNHKKRDILFLTITLANLNRFLLFSYYFNREEILHEIVLKFTISP